MQRLLDLAARLIIGAPKPPVHLLALPARQAASRREGRRSPTHGSCVAGRAQLRPGAFVGRSGGVAGGRWAGVVVGDTYTLTLTPSALGTT